MNRRTLPQRIPALLVSIIVASLGPNGVAHSSCPIDQEQALGSAFVSIVGASGASINRVAQTFTVGMDGDLGAIHVRGAVSAAPAGIGPLTIQIFPTVGGVPDESGGALLTKIVPFSELPSGVSPLPEVVFDVSAFALPVQAGEVLAITLSAPSGAFLCVMRPSAPYADGTAWYRVQSESAWTDAEADMFFRTVVCTDAVSVQKPGIIADSWGQTKSAYRAANSTD